MFLLKWVGITMRKKVYIFGVGLGKDVVLDCLKDSVGIAAYIDNYSGIQGGKIDNKEVFALDQIKYDDDIVIINSLMKRNGEVKEQLLEYGFRDEQIIPFWDDDYIDKNELFVSDYIEKKYLVWDRITKSKKRLGKWYEIYAELERLKNNEDVLDIAVVGVNELSQYFAKSILDSNHNLHLIGGGVAAIDTQNVPKNFGLKVYDFCNLIYENKDNLSVYIIEPLNVKKYQGELLEMGFSNIRILGEDQRGIKLADVYDVTLGYTWYCGKDKEKPGFVVFRNDKHVDNVFRIVTLGGSTSDPTMANIKSWSEILFDKMNHLNVGIEVWAGGLGGYVVTQEFNKFVRDVILLKPNLVLSYSGINDAVNVFYYEPEHPFVLKYQAELLRTNIENGQVINTIDYNIPIHEYTCGLEDKRNSAEHWIDCERMMKAICNELGIAFFAFLQPYGARVDGIRDFSGFRWKQIEEFYRIAKQKIDSENLSTWLIDFTNIFEGEKNIFFDNCHVYEKGNRIIAEKIMPYVLETMHNFHNCSLAKKSGYKHDSY